MTTLVATHYSIPRSTRSTSKVWKQCSCCPYGYHIDLDFVNYCENVVNSQLLPRAVGVSRKPKKRASMDVLLGIPQSSQLIQQPVKAKEKDYSTTWAWDGLERAVQDFELTLQRASTHGPGILSKSETEKETKGDWFKNLKAGIPWRKRDKNKSAQWSGKDGDVCRGITSNWLTKDNNELYYSMDRPSVWSNLGKQSETSGVTETLNNQSTVDTTDSSEYNSISQETLQQIRQQVASSLSEIKRLENQVKQVPALQEEITRLNNENSYLTEKIKQMESKTEEVSNKPEEPLPKKRNIAVGTSIITRDVGVSHKLPLTVTTGAMTDHYESLPAKPSPPPKTDFLTVSSYCQTDKYYEISLSHKSSQTTLKMDTIYSSDDLERNIDKAIKLYEKTYHHLLHPHKPFMVNSSAQVDTKTPIRRDYAVQTRRDTCDAGVLFKPDCRNSGIQTLEKHKFTRDVAVSDDTILDYCQKCTVRKISRGTEMTPDKVLKLVSLSTRSNTFDQLDLYKKSSRSIGVGPEKSVSSSKSTDTRELNIKKDIAVNTTKNKLVDTAVDPISRPPSSLKRRGSGSKIPRPVNLPVRSRSLNRQDTYTISSPSPSRKSQGSEVYDYESGSEEGTSNYNSPLTTRNLVESPEPIFPALRSTDVHRVRKDVSQDVRGALKVLNDGLVQINEGNPSYNIRNALAIVQQDWFQVSSTASADPLHVEDYLDIFEEFSPELLKFIVNMVDSTGNTAMHYAVSHGNFNVVSVLLDSKVCDINKRNAAGFTCIMLVSLAKVKSISDRQIIRKLFQIADVNLRAKQHGQTSLMLAVSHGRMDIVELLLDSGADINIQDEDGSTALMCAAEHGHIDIVKFLLTQPECDLTITDCDGNTALNIAMEAGNRDIGVLLYAQQHFSRGGSPYTSFKSKKKNSSTTPTRTPTSPLPTKKF